MQPQHTSYQCSLSVLDESLLCDGNVLELSYLLPLDTQSKLHQEHLPLLADVLTQLLSLHITIPGPRRRKVLRCSVLGDMC